MKAKVTGKSAWQGTPISGTLDVEIRGRYVDSSGNATVSHYSGVLNADKTGWVDAKTNQDLYLVVQGPDDPAGPRATFLEVLDYGTNSVRTTFTRKLISTDLQGLFFDYAAPEVGTPAGFGDAPLSMQAAAAVIAQSAQVQQSLADIAQSAADAAAAAGMIPAATYAAIPATAGIYRLMTGADAGQVWERSGGVLTRRSDLETLTKTSVTPALSLTRYAKGDGSNESTAILSAFGDAKTRGWALTHDGATTVRTSTPLTIDTDGQELRGPGMYARAMLGALGANRVIDIVNGTVKTARRRVALLNLALAGKVRINNWVDVALSNVSLQGGHDHTLEIGGGFKGMFFNLNANGAQTGDGVHVQLDPDTTFLETNNLLFFGGQQEGNGRYGFSSDVSARLNHALWAGTIVEGNWTAGGGGVDVPNGHGLTFLSIYNEGNRNFNGRFGTLTQTTYNVQGFGIRNDGYGDESKDYEGATTFTPTSVTLLGYDLSGVGPGDTLTAGTYVVAAASGGTVWDNTAKTITVTGTDLSAVRPLDLFYTPALGSGTHAGRVESITGAGINWTVTTYGLFISGAPDTTSAPAAGVAVEFRRPIQATGVVSGTRSGTIIVTGWTPSTPTAGSAFKRIRSRSKLGYHFRNVDGAFFTGYSRGFEGSAAIVEDGCLNIDLSHLIEIQGDAKSLPTTLLGKDLNHPLRGLNLARNGDFALVSAGKPVGWAQNAGTVSAVTLGDGRAALQIVNIVGQSAASAVYNADELLTSARGGRMALSFMGLCDLANSLRVRVSDGVNTYFGVTYHPGGGLERNQGMVFNVSAAANQLRVTLETTTIPLTGTATAQITNFRMGFADSVAQLSGYPTRPTPVIRGVGAPEGVVTAPVGVSYEDVPTGGLYRKTIDGGTIGWRQLAFAAAPAASVTHTWQGTSLTRNPNLTRNSGGTIIEEWYRNNGNGVISYVTLADGRSRPNIAVGANAVEALGQNHDLFSGDFAGATLTFVGSLICDQPNRARLRLNINGVSTYSAYHTGDGTEQLLSVTAAVPQTMAALSQLRTLLDIPATANAVNVRPTGLKLAVAGDAATALAAPPIPYELLPSAQGTGTATAGAGAAVALTNMSLTQYRVIVTPNSAGAPNPVSIVRTSSGFTAYASANQGYEYTVIPRV
jgi:hypothetical protein